MFYLVWRFLFKFKCLQSNFQSFPLLILVLSHTKVFYSLGYKEMHSYISKHFACLKHRDCQDWVYTMCHFKYKTKLGFLDCIYDFLKTTMMKYQYVC